MGIGRPAASVGIGDTERAGWLRLFGSDCRSGVPWAAANTGAAMSRTPNNAARWADVIFTSESATLARSGGRSRASGGKPGLRQFGTWPRCWAQNSVAGIFALSIVASIAAADLNPIYKAFSTRH